MTTDDGDELVDFDLIDRSKCQHCGAHLTKRRCGLDAALAPPDDGESDREEEPEILVPRKGPPVPIKGHTEGRRIVWDHEEENG
jgi:hypothetical protein